MNKKHITLILAGILLLVLQFNIPIGPVYIDICSDLVGCVLIAIGGFPISGRNVIFKKMRGIIILGLVLSALGLAISIFGGISHSTYTSEIVTGLSTVILIYFTYYFTEGLMLEAKFQEKSAATRSFRIIWFILAALVFVSFIAVTSGITTLTIIAQAVTAIFAIYFCSSTLTACNQLYMEGLPTKHMKL